MRKTLTALAVLGAFAGSALATDITLYGVVDLGLQYQNTKIDASANRASGEHESWDITSDTWGLESGSNSGSRWGIKGSEQISEDITVGFQLEQGFNADAGDYADDDRFFNRESRLYIQTPFGEIGMGRMGSLDSGLGSYDLMEAASAFGTGWGSTIGSSTAILRGMGDRMDNTITYKSPQFGGVTVLAQVSLSPDSDGREGSSDTDRYYALGVKGQWNAFEVALVASTTDYNREFAGGPYPSNSKVVTGYVAYDCGVAKTTLSAQYYDDMRKSLVDYDSDDLVIDLLMNIFESKGYGVMLSTTATLSGGEFLASVGYADYETALDPNYFFDTFNADAFNVGVGYQYPLSKRTFVYAGAGYTKVSSDITRGVGKASYDEKTIEVVSGLVHTF